MDHIKIAPMIDTDVKEYKPTRKEREAAKERMAEETAASVRRLEKEAVSETPRRRRGKSAHRVARHAERDLRERALAFLQRWGLLIAAVAGIIVWTLAVCLITAGVVRSRTTATVTETVTARMEEEMERRLTAQEISFRSEKMLTDGEKLQQADESDALARLLYGYRQNSRRDLRTLCWCVLCRVDNPNYPDSVRAVVEQDKQWMFYNGSNPVRADFEKIAQEVLEMWRDGHYPEGLSSDFVFAEWSPDSVQLRDRWEKNSRTVYWRAAE